MRKRVITALAGALVLALALASCGGGDDDAPLTKAQFIKQADEVCEEGAKRVQDDFEAFVKENEDSKPTDTDYAELVSTILAPNAEQESEEIEELGIPIGDEKQIEAMLEARDEGLEAAEAQPKAVVTNGEDIFAKATAIATKYGLEACARR